MKADINRGPIVMGARALLEVRRPAWLAGHAFPGIARGQGWSLELVDRVDVLCSGGAGAG